MIYSKKTYLPPCFHRHPSVLGMYKRIPTSAVLRRSKNMMVQMIEEF